MLNSLPESAGSIEKSSTLIKFSPDEKIDTEADELDLPLAQWTQSHNKRRVATPQTSTQKVSSNAKIKPVISWSKRFVSLDIIVLMNLKH